MYLLDSLKPSKLCILTVHLYISVELDEVDPLSLFVFPRLVIVNKNDHKHAALYPPATRRREENEEFSRETIMSFAQSYLQAPENWIIETEHF